MSHILELRKRLIFVFLFFIISFAISYFFAAQIYDFLLIPLSKSSDLPHKLIYTGLSEAFMSYIRMSFFIAIIITFPYLNFHLYRFIAPGLYIKEKKYFKVSIFFAPLLFYGGCAFAYYIIFPLAWKFFVSFENFSGYLPVILEARISEYLSFSMKIMIAFGIVFQLPILMFLCIRAGIISVATLAKQRKYVFLIFFIVGAVITPPDIISQIGIALPMYLLFELTLLISKRNSK